MIDLKLMSVLICTARKVSGLLSCFPFSSLFIQHCRSTPQEFCLAGVGTAMRPEELSASSHSSSGTDIAYTISPQQPELQDLHAGSETQPISIEEAPAVAQQKNFAQGKSSEATNAAAQPEVFAANQGAEDMHQNNVAISSPEASHHGDQAALEMPLALMEMGDHFSKMVQ